MTRKTKKAKRDIYQEVTDSIIKSLEDGVRPWSKPWSTGRSFAGASAFPLRHNGTPYRGVNVLILWSQGYSNPTWMTYKQAAEYGGQVRGGEKGTTVTFFKKIKIQDKVSGEDKDIPLLRGYSVFNADQIDGLPDRFYGTAIEPVVVDEKTRVEELEAFVSNTGATVKHGGSRACYHTVLDYIQSPNFEDFTDADGYYSTMFHELGHWTGNEQRLDRTFGKRFGDVQYAKEELVAELTAAFICASTGVSDSPREDHASYLKSWAAQFKDDKKYIFQAASAAQKAADYLLDLQPAETEEAA